MQALCQDVHATLVGVTMKRGLDQEFLMQAIILTFEGDHMAVCKCGCFLGPAGNLCCYQCWGEGRQPQVDSDEEEDALGKESTSVSLFFQ